MLFDALERDAITELLNVAVSRSATALSRMVGKPVAMSVPDVRALSRTAALDTIAANRSTPLIAVGEQFSGPFSGRALLVFPETRSLHLVQAIVGEHLSLEEIADLEEDAMIEVGNVILNNCLSGIANMLGCRIEATLPHCFQGGGEQIFKRTIRDDDGGIVLFTSIDFSIRDRDIGGFIILLMDLNAISNLRNAVTRYVDGVRRPMPGPTSP